jgi:chromosome segregation ATPase
VIASVREQIAERDQQLADMRIVMNERGRELESARAEVAYLSTGLDSLNATANEKHAEVTQLLTSLRDTHAALDAAQSAVEHLSAERDALNSEVAAASSRIEALAGENSTLHAEISAVLLNAAQLQAELDETRAQLAQVQHAHAALSATSAEQADEMSALIHATEQAEARAADLGAALAAAGARQIQLEAELQAGAARLLALEQDHAALLAAKTAVDEILETQAGEIDVLAALQQQHQAAISQAEARLEALSVELEQAVAGKAALQSALLENETCLAQAQASLGELRQAHTLLLQEHETARYTRDALEVQTRNQMEKLVVLSDEMALLQKQLQERESALQAEQAALAETRQKIATKPEPGTVEARLIDVTLTLQRLERDYAALQAEKDAIEDEYSREQIAARLSVQEKEIALRECAAQTDALALEVALLKAKGE